MDFELINSIKNLKNLDFYVAKYIYKKYIETSVQNDDIVYKYSSKVLDKYKFKLYLDTIFNKQRPHLITQKELLEQEIEAINEADIKFDDLQEESVNYLTSESRFPRSKTKSYPDTMRCTYIIKSKNKYKRCSLKVFSNDIEYCKKHANQPNLFWDKYCELLDTL